MTEDATAADELIARGRWTEALASRLSSGGVRRLVLNYACGFDELSLDFLVGAPLRELVIIDRRLQDLGPVHTLGATLEKLEVVTSADLRIDLAQFPRLKHLSADWAQISDSVEHADELTDLFLLRFAEPDLEVLQCLSQLQSLRFKDRPKFESLSGVEDLHELRELGIYLATRLADVSGVAGLENLESLTLEACKRITHLEPLRDLTKLRHLNVSDSGDIDSLAPLSKLQRLESLYLYESTRVLDDDLSPVAALPALSDFRMRSRRSYRPSVPEIHELLLGR